MVEIKKGDKFLCIKDLVTYCGDTVFTKDKEYTSVVDDWLIDDNRDLCHYLFIEEPNQHFEKILSEENEDTLIMKEAREEAEKIKTHIDKGGRYKIITDSASFQVGDLWIRAVVYECLDNNVIYVREYENFCKRFCPLN